MSGIDSKICYTCKQEKPLTDFKKQERSTNGRANQCKSCYNIYNRKWRETHPSSNLPDLSIMKKCTKCGMEKYASEFIKVKRIKTGIASICLECDQIYKKIYYKNRMKDPEYARKDREWRRNWKRERYANDPEYREREMARERNPHRKAWRRKWLLNDKKNKTLLYFARNTITKHRQNGYDVRFSAEELEAKRQLTTACELCGVVFDDSIWNHHSLDRINNDIIMFISNIRIICHRCNTMKGNQTDDQLLDQCRKIIEHASLNRTNP